MAAFYTTMLLIQPYVRVDIVLIFEKKNTLAWPEPFAKRGILDS
jgi:hypothetical protein